jgi:hypothetical protein
MQNVKFTHIILVCFLACNNVYQIVGQFSFRDRFLGHHIREAYFCSYWSTVWLLDRVAYRFRVRVRVRVRVIERIIYVKRA